MHVSDVCPHGYFTQQFQFVPCPGCYGFNEKNKNVVPVRGRGNGWLLERGMGVCLDCGGPGWAGHGIIPEYMTHEYWAQIVTQPSVCYGCSSARAARGQGMPHVRGYEEHEVPIAVRAEAARRAAEARREIESRGQDKPPPLDAGDGPYAGERF